MSLDVYLEVDGCSSCGRSASEVFHWNVTHNLSKMADAAGIYLAMWRPSELREGPRGVDLVEALRAGVAALRADPEKFEAMNPSNGWGDYDGLLAAAEAYLASCVRYPNARVVASR